MLARRNQHPAPSISKDLVSKTMSRNQMRVGGKLWINIGQKIKKQLRIIYCFEISWSLTLEELFFVRGLLL